MNGLGLRAYRLRVGSTKCLIAARTSGYAIIEEVAKHFDSGDFNILVIMM